MKHKHLLIFAFVSACTASANPDPWVLSESDAAVDAAVDATVDATVDSSSTNNSAPCEETPFDCVRSCSSDTTQSAECVDGKWTCAMEDGSWIPRSACLDCTTPSVSELPGVSLSLEPDRCGWTREELARGIEIPYVVRIENSVDIIAVAQDGGGCGRPDESGLIIYYEITGDNDQRYCLCDVGLCPRVRDAVTLRPGVHRGIVSWNGTNWLGPSDTGNPYGRPFTTGDATLTVNAAYLDANGTQRYVASRMTIRVL